MTNYTYICIILQLERSPHKEQVHIPKFREYIGTVQYKAKSITTT